MDPNSTKRPMAQRTMLAFIKKKRTDEENLLEMTAATNSNVESSMVSAASNVQSRTNVESLVDRNVDVHMDVPSTSSAPVAVETVPAESATTHPVLTQEQCEALINKFLLKVKFTTTIPVSTNVQKSLNRNYEELSQRNLTTNGWKKSTTGGFAMSRGRECFVSFVKNMALEIPRTKPTNLQEWHPIDSSQMRLKRTRNQGATRVL